MLFFWNPDKAEKNVEKHKVSFEIAQTIFEDPLHLSNLDDEKHEEERWVSMGRSCKGDIFVVVHTYLEIQGHEEIRIISARRATKKERRAYEEGI